MVEPAEIFALPENAVLWLGHPVTFAWEEHHASRDATHSCCVEGLHSLAVRDTEVVFASHYEDWGVPVLNVVLRVGFTVTAHSHFVVLIPRCTTEVPVHEPQFFGFAVLSAKVEDTSV